MTTSDTRQRIVRATRELHEEVGPAATTISAIARRAGVQRLTVYRHFPDERALIFACSSDWAADHPLPDASAWLGIVAPEERMRAALRAVYAYYRRGSAMLERVLRDEAQVPELAEVMEPWWQALREIAGGLSAGWGMDAGGQRILRAAVGHALRFETWRSLTDEGLDDEEAVSAMERWVAGLRGTR